MPASTFSPISQASNHFPIDVSGGNVDIKTVTPRGEGACALYVSNNDDTTCVVVVWAADQDPTDGAQDPQTYRVPSGTWLPILVRMVVQTGTAADVILGQINRGR